MSEKMPESMDEEAVREWVWELAGRGEGTLARAVLALVAAKVREGVQLAVDETIDAAAHKTGYPNTPAIVARVMGKEEKS